MADEARFQLLVDTVKAMERCVKMLHEDLRAIEQRLLSLEDVAYREAYGVPPDGCGATGLIEKP